MGVGSAPVHNPVEAARAIEAALHKPGQAIALRIFHDGQPAFVALKLGAKPGNG